MGPNWAKIEWAQSSPSRLAKWVRTVLRCAPRESVFLRVLRHEPLVSLPQISEIQKLTLSLAQLELMTDAVVPVAARKRTPQVLPPLPSRFLTRLRQEQSLLGAGRFLLTTAFSPLSTGPVFAELSRSKQRQLRLGPVDGIKTATNWVKGDVSQSTDRGVLC
jgi:hypothetical protein